MNNEALRRYLDGLFASAPQNKKAFELKEELLINMNEKYQDLLNEGYSEQDAYNMVIAGIGDVDELISGIIQPNPLNPAQTQEQKRKTALVVIAAVALGIIALLGIVMVDEFIGNDALAMAAFFVPCAIGAAILIYHFMTRPKYTREEDTIVEEFKEWKSQEERQKGLFGALSSILWTVVTVVYFLISFQFGNWHISWIIFLIGFVLQQMLRLIINMMPAKWKMVHLSEKQKKIRNSVVSLVWTLTVVIYFIISFMFPIWHVSWVIFLVGGAVTSLVNLLFQIKR